MVLTEKCLNIAQEINRFFHMGNVVGSIDDRILNSRIVFDVFKEKFFYRFLLTPTDEVDTVIDLFQGIGDIALGIVTAHTCVDRLWRKT